MASYSQGKEHTAVDPTPIMRLATAHWEAQVLLTANRLGLFATLAAAPLSVQEVSAALATHVRPTRFFLQACVALGLLQEVEGKFRNSPLSMAFLVPGRPAYMGDMIQYSDDLYATWGHLEQALRQDCPQLAPTAYLGADPEKTRHFVYGMHHRALGIGRALVELVDLSGCQRLLDIGGGPGTYAALFAQRYPTLHANVLDLPRIVALAHEILVSLGTNDRVTVMAGDYHTTALPPDNDVVLISGVLHREAPEACRALIARAHESLSAGGQLIVADVLTDAGGTSPAFATLFGLNMLLTATDGGVHADAEVVAWMRQAGFRHTDVRPFPPPMPHKVIVGRAE